MIKDLLVILIASSLVMGSSGYKPSRNLESPTGTTDTLSI